MTSEELIIDELTRENEELRAECSTLKQQRSEKEAENKDLRAEINKLLAE